MKLFFPLVAILTTMCAVEVTYAQAGTGSSEVNTTEGVSGFLDKKRRAPSLSVGVSRNGKSAVKLLADAYVANEEYVDYPIKFEFFVNRTLVATQIRSKELAGPVGIDVDASKTPFPFNYSVIATVLGPNRTFTTVLNGAVFSADLASNGSISSCQLTLSDQVTTQSESSNTTYLAQTVTVSQVSNSQIQVAFETATLADGTEVDPVSVTALVAVDGETASGEISVGGADGAPVKTAASGSATLKDSQVVKFSIATSDSQTTLSCD
jgi:hypothetical protein